MRSTSRAILLGNSPEPSLKELKSVLRKLSITSKDFLIGVDLGAWRWKQLGFSPHFAIGDWDSLKKMGKRKVDSLLSEIPHSHLEQKKDRSDTFHAIHQAFKLGFRHLVGLGLTGGRPDHQLAVLQDFAQWANRKSSFQSLSLLDIRARYDFVSPEMGVLDKSTQKNKIFSIFPLLGQAQGVELKGAVYPLNKENLLPSSRGLSNRTQASRLTLSLQKGVLVVIWPQADN